MTARKNGYGYFPAPDLNTVSHTMHPKPRAKRSDHKNQTWGPELRIETLDPDRNWIACFIHDTGFDHNRSRARQALHHSPADPPHTKAYSIINPVPLLPQPNGSKQQGTWVLLF